MFYHTTDKYCRRNMYNVIGAESWHALLKSAIGKKSCFFLFLNLIILLFHVSTQQVASPSAIPQESLEVPVHAAAPDRAELAVRGATAS